jgi:Arc/MetJ-type ribon-helix-helix transcriptional regulator
MKQKLSISMDEETVSQLEGVIESGRFRNKSHVIEYAVNSVLKEKSNENE